MHIWDWIAAGDEISDFYAEQAGEDRKQTKRLKKLGRELVRYCDENADEVADWIAENIYETDGLRVIIAAEYDPSEGALVILPREVHVQDDWHEESIWDASFPVVYMDEDECDWDSLTLARQVFQDLADKLD